MRLLKHIYSGLVAVAAMTMLPSCNSIMEEGGVCPESDTVVMSFKMLTSAPLTGTRADDHNHDEVDSEFREFEDGINVNDFAFFIFVGTGDDAKLVVKNTNIATSTEPGTMITGSPGAYTVTVNIDRTRLDGFIGHAVKPNSSDVVNFRFLVFANCNAMSSINDIPETSTYKDVVDVASEWSYRMDNIYSAASGYDSGVDGIYKGNIPMFGTNDFKTTEGALYASQSHERIYLGDVDLLRAVAKVRVLDNIQNKDEEGFPKIVMAQFRGSQDVLRQLPANALTYKNGNQVHLPNIFDLASIEEVEGYTLGTIPSDWEMAGTVSSQTRIGYVPEQSIGVFKNNNAYDILPKFWLRIALQKKSDGTIEYKEYEVPMTKYENQPDFKFGENILRNHIYTLSVNQVKLGTPLNLTFNVSPWTSSRLELDYKDIPTVANEIEWVQGTYQPATGNNMEIYTLAWDSQANRKAAECSFTISAPLNTTWTATLVPVEGEVGAFKFLNAAGDEVDQIEGVTGIGSELQIVSVKPNPSQKNSAMLQVMVDMGYGYVQAPVAGNNGNYIISQRVN